jgi:hypothetical protein
MHSITPSSPEVLLHGHGSGDDGVVDALWVVGADVGTGAPPLLLLMLSHCCVLKYVWQS